MARAISIVIDVDCADDTQHLLVSNFLKDILSLLDMEIERKHRINDFRYVIRGEHGDSFTRDLTKIQHHPLADAFGLNK